MFRLLRHPEARWRARPLVLQPARVCAQRPPSRCERGSSMHSSAYNVLVSVARDGQTCIGTVASCKAQRRLTSVRPSDDNGAVAAAPPSKTTFRSSSARSPLLCDQFTLRTLLGKPSTSSQDVARGPREFFSSAELVQTAVPEHEGDVAVQSRCCDLCSKSVQSATARNLERLGSLGHMSNTPRQRAAYQR